MRFTSNFALIFVALAGASTIFARPVDQTEDGLVARDNKRVPAGPNAQLSPIEVAAVKTLLDQLVKAQTVGKPKHHGIFGRWRHGEKEAHHFLGSAQSTLVQSLPALQRRSSAGKDFPVTPSGRLNKGGITPTAFGNTGHPNGFGGTRPHIEGEKGPISHDAAQTKAMQNSLLEGLPFGGSGGPTTTPKAGSYGQAGKDKIHRRSPLPAGESPPRTPTTPPAQTGGRPPTPSAPRADRGRSRSRERETTPTPLPAPASNHPNPSTPPAQTSGGRNPPTPSAPRADRGRESHRTPSSSPTNRRPSNIPNTHNVPSLSHSTPSPSRSSSPSPQTPSSAIQSFGTPGIAPSSNPPSPSSSP